MEKQITHKIQNQFETAQVSNEVLYNNQLSFKAKGLYCYIVAKPDDWNFSSKRIVIETKDSEKTIRKLLKELEEIGYLKRQKLSNGRTIYLIKHRLKDEFPQYEPSGKKGSLGIKKPIGKKGYQQKGLPAKITAIRKKEYKQINNNNKEITLQADACEDKIDVNYFIDLFKDVNISYDRLFANKTERESIERLYKKIGGDKLEKAINTLKVTNGEKYAPKITTPYELEKNFSKLCFFIKGKVVEDSKRSIPGMEKYQRS